MMSLDQQLADQRVIDVNKDFMMSLDQHATDVINDTQILYSRDYL